MAYGMNLIQASPILLFGRRRLYVEKKRPAYTSEFVGIYMFNDQRIVLLRLRFCLVEESGYWETPSSDAVDNTVNGNNKESQGKDVVLYRLVFFFFYNLLYTV